MSRRVFVGGLAHETHSFAATPTTLADFQRYEWAEGADLLASYAGTRTSLGGIIAGAPGARLDLISGFYTFAMPSGPVPHADFTKLRDRLLTSLAAEQVDGVVLVLHGAMVANGVDDVEGEVLMTVRAAVGPDVPVVATLDLHANISRQMASAADLLVGYDTYPHVDVYERGVEAAMLLGRLLDGETRPTTAFASVPILAVPQRQNTEVEPMRTLFARVHEIERDPAVLTVTLAGGFCYSDVPQAGMAVTVSTDNAPELALRYARELQAMAWARRAAFQIENLPVVDAVSQAITNPAAEGPAILVDVADNIGGGAPGDGTVLLAELLRQRARGAVVVVADPKAVAVACAVGVGGSFKGMVGGKTDRLHGDPLSIEGRVRLLSDGEFVYRGSYMSGQVRQMGRTAVVVVDGTVVVLTERKTMPFDAEQLRSVGITPEHCRIIVVKSATAWRAAYEEMASLVLDVDTPGICSANLATLPYRNLRRPISPLDADDAIVLPEVVLG